jgi:hypothetical protein
MVFLNKIIFGNKGVMVVTKLLSIIIYFQPRI